MSHAQCQHRSLAKVIRRAISLIIVGLIVAGSVAMGHGAGNSFAVPSYWLLALISCALVIPFKVTRDATLQKVLATYLTTMGVDYLSNVYWPLAANLQIAAGMSIMAAAVLAACIAPRREAGIARSGDVTIATGAVIAVIATLLLSTGLLIHSWYGFGAERSLGVFGQIAMALLTGVAVWRLADDLAVRIAIGVSGFAAYSWMTVS